MTDTVIVRFEGDGSGVAELSWGDRDTAFEGAALGDTAERGTRAVPAMGAVR